MDKELLPKYTSKEDTRKIPSDWNSVPEGDVKKLYAVGCHSAEDWKYIHEILLEDGTLEDNIPSEVIECGDIKEHSDTRAVYLLTDTEAEKLKEHPRVKFVHINYESYLADFAPPPDELTCTKFRYVKTNTKQYRNWYDNSLLPTTPSASDINRSGYQILRCVQKRDPWYGRPDSTIINDRISYAGDGTDVDLVVGDEGCWFGHVEFQNNTGNGPTYYRGGNVLPGNGTCDVLDLVLDAPYYIDPNWFNADPELRLITRWDGTIVPDETYAIAWWGDASLRSSEFSNIGTVTVTSSYTRSACNGSNQAITTNGSIHGTQCSALAFGRTQGWAFNANKWFINAYGNNGSGDEQYFTILKLFHLYKPINSSYGTKDPTISSNSWGLRAVPASSGYYYYRSGISGAGGVSYTSSTKPGFMKYVGSVGDGGRMKGEMVENSYTTSGKELIDVGVIFVVAAGNANQKQVGPTHPDFNNYWASDANTPLTSATHLEFGITAYNTTNRRGFPQQLGKYNDPQTGTVVYPTINIGALDDSYMSNGQERKVNYSDMGEEIDCYAPADGTLAAVNRLSGKLRYDTYSSGPLYDFGVSLIADSSNQISGTESFNSTPNSGQRITTSVFTGTVNTISNNLLGPLSLTASTTPTSGSNDDGYWILNLPFNIFFADTSYGSIYVGTNSYITFSDGSIEYANFNGSNPALPKILISASDNSCQRIYYGTEGSSPNRTFRVRYEGTDSSSGTLGSPRIVWEAVFYENDPSQIDIQIGVNARYASGITQFYDTKFSGTSSACPVAVGLIATKLQYCRNWTWQDVRNWLRGNNKPPEGISTIEVQSNSTFYYGVESTTANAATWADLNSLEGGQARVIYDALTGYEPVSLQIGSRKEISNNILPEDNTLDLIGSPNGLKLNYRK